MYLCVVFVGVRVFVVSFPICDINVGGKINKTTFAIDHKLRRLGLLGKVVEMGRIFLIPTISFACRRFDEHGIRQSLLVGNGS